MKYEDFDVNAFAEKASLLSSLTMLLPYARNSAAYDDLVEAVMKLRMELAESVDGG